jgi:hypothetical protein
VTPARVLSGQRFIKHTWPSLVQLLEVLVAGQRFRHVVKGLSSHWTHRCALPVPPINAGRESRIGGQSSRLSACERGAFSLGSAGGLLSTRASRQCEGKGLGFWKIIPGLAQPRPSALPTAIVVVETLCVWELPLTRDAARSAAISVRGFWRYWDTVSYFWSQQRLSMPDPGCFRTQHLSHGT